MRETDTPQEPFAPLGRAIPPKPTPVPSNKPLEHNKEVVVTPDGKFQTNITNNNKARIVPPTEPDLWEFWGYKPSKYMLTKEIAPTWFDYSEHLRGLPTISVSHWGMFPVVSIPTYNFEDDL